MAAGSGAGVGGAGGPSKIGRHKPGEAGREGKGRNGLQRTHSNMSEDESSTNMKKTCSLSPVAQDHYTLGNRYSKKDESIAQGTDQHVTA